MAETNMAVANRNIKEFGQACYGMREASGQAAESINRFVAVHHDAMNAWATARVLRSMGYPQLARWFG